MYSDPATTCEGFAGFVSVPDTKTMSGAQAWKGFPHVLRTSEPRCRTSAPQGDGQPNPAEKQGIEMPKARGLWYRPKGFSCEMKNTHQHYARKE